MTGWLAAAGSDAIHTLDLLDAKRFSSTGIDPRIRRVGKYPGERLAQPHSQPQAL
jgi:hypothetical protein